MHRALVAIAIVALVPAVAEAGDPLRVWKTVESDHFVVHYYEPLDDLARRVAVVGERAHRSLVPAFGHDPEEKTHILLVDDVDGANGFANVLPRNAITLFATAPSGSSALNDHDDWMYGLVTHEYTHVIHLDTIVGLPKLYNRIFGKTWSPNQIMPRWVIEGIATYEESKRSSSGRTRNTGFDMSLRLPVLQKRALGLDEVSGAPRQFPRGNAAYLYGSHFLRYIFDRYGEDTLRKMNQASAEHPLPFAVNRQIASVIGRPFDDLYGDWNRHMRDRYALQAEGVARRGRREGRQLTFSSEVNVAPRYTHDGKELVWLQNTGYDHGAVRAMPVGGDESSKRHVREIDSIGGFTVASDGSLVYEQSHSYRQDYQYQDIFHWDRRADRTTRLTVGKRGRDPALSPDEKWVAFSMNGESRSTLAVIPLAPASQPEVVWSGARYDQVYTPAWSPDGTRIAFSAWRHGGLRDILILERATGAVTEVTRDRAIDASPEWSPDGAYLYFESDRSGISNVYAWHVATGALWQVTNVVGGAFEPVPSPDGKRIAYHGFVGDGYDLFEVDADPEAWARAPGYVDRRPDPSDVRDHEVHVDRPRPYRPLETLAPQVYTAQLELGNRSRILALSTYGADIAGLHGYSLGLTIDLERGDVNFGAGYNYTPLRVPFRVVGSRSINRRGGYIIDGQNLEFTEESYAATLSFGVPGERKPGGFWNLSLDYDFDYNRVVDSPFDGFDPNEGVPTTPPVDFVQTGIAVRGGIGTVHGTAYSTGADDGFDAFASLRLDHPAIGAEFRAIAVNWNARKFLAAPWGRTQTFMLRLAGGIRAGDIQRTGAFALGAIPQQDVVRAIIDSTRIGNTGFLRGYPSRTIDGNQFHLLNVEYRHELYNIERGLGTLPAYFKRVHAAGLIDAGAAFDDDPAWDDSRISAGAAVRVDTLFGFFVSGSFEVGYMRGLTDDGVNELWLHLTGIL
jgi:Tol biopolymer transport system component